MSEAIDVFLLMASRPSGSSWRTLVQSLLFIGGVTLLHGCVAVPVPVALADPEPFTSDRMTPIRIGHTTRDEVRALFAEWRYETDRGVEVAHLEPQVAEGGRYWAFNLRRLGGDVAWAGLWATEVGPVPFFRGKQDNYDEFWALFEFNDDAVARFWISGDKTPCLVGGACYANGYLQIIGDEPIFASRRTDAAAVDHCVVYAYADADFELPLKVTDGIHAGWLFSKASFVRFEVASGPATVSVWYEFVPGSAISMPIVCAGGEVRYWALRPHKGLIEALPVASSVAERVVNKGRLVERLVPVSAGVAPAYPASTWTNCTAPEPCRELAILRIERSFSTEGVRGVSLVVDGAEKFHDTRGRESYLLLHPAVYTLSSNVSSAFTRTRVDTFELQSGHFYRIANASVECEGLVAIFSAKEARAQVCSESRNGLARSGSVTTNWFEDVVTGRVVAGQKWCAGDPECPESQCVKHEGQTRGICNIRELQCTYGESCRPR